MSEQQPWDQQPGESALWFGRFERYRLMWPHSLVRVYQDEWRQEYEEKKGEKGRIDPALEREIPAKAPGKWYEMSNQWHWTERAAAWDASFIAEVEQRVVAEKTRTLLTGYALSHRRVAQLNDQAEQLIAMLSDPNKVWVPDVKSVGTGPDAERVDLVQFNSALFHEIRSTFDDIAKELGERVKKGEVALTLLPKVYQGTDPDEDGIVE